MSESVAVIQGEQRMKREKISRRIFGDPFATHILENRVVPADAEVTQMVNDHYVLPAFLLRIPSPTSQSEQFVMQGATIHLTHRGVRLQGFVEQASHHVERPTKADQPGIFRREEWHVPLSSLE